MSSGPAITVSERNIENMKSSPMIFGGPKNEGLLHEDSPIEFRVENPNLTMTSRTPISGDKLQLKQGESGDGRVNNILQPARNENVKQSVVKKSTGKAEQPSNYIIPNKHQVPMIIGASGDGIAPDEKSSISTNQNSGSDIVNHQQVNCLKESHPWKKNYRFENEKTQSKTSMQTYAKVAQNLPANVKNADVKTENVPLLRKPANNALPTTIPQENDSTPVVNGIMEDDLESATAGVPPTETTTSPSTSERKALKETIGHVSKLPDDTSVSRAGNDICSNEQDFQILSNPERAGDDGAFDVQQQFEGSVANADTEFNMSSKLGTGSSRRETEKPPRMQKQRSQDRLLMKQQKSFDSDSKRETLSRESSAECVDSTGVDVHEFLINTLRNSTRDRAILLKIEHDMIGFVNNKTSDFMKFPPMTSYHRMLVHRVAAYFGMDHNVDETGRSVIINKTNTTRLPEVRFGDQFDPRQTDQPSSRRDDDMRRRSILKRTNQSRSFDRDDMKGGSSWKDRQRSIEEREEQYEKVRARIFNNPEANMNSPPMYGRRAMSSLAAARMAGWSDRPWNSSDVDPSMRMAGPRLTTRASSYSSISVLPRHNSATSVKTGSSSSVSSMNGVNSNMQNFAQGRQTHGMGMRPPTPGRRNGMGDNNNGAYYYMQPQNQGMPYLSPEGYQLVYQSGGPGQAGNSGMSSPQFARYYQIPPSQPSPHHPGMAYSHGYNPYEESPHKAQGSTNTDYTMMSPMSSYAHNISSTSTVYSGVQGQPSIGYTYQAATVYHPTSEPPMTVAQSQAGMQPGSQGKQTPIIQQGGQSYIQQSPLSATVAYPHYIVGPPQAPPHQHQSGSKDGSTTPRNMVPQVVPNMQHVPAVHQVQQTIPVFSPPGGLNSTPHQSNSKEGYSQSVQNETSKSSNLSQDGKKTTDDELNEKMQAIVLKNLQQQQVKQLPDSSASESSNTVTTSFSPSASRNSKPVPETANQTHTGNLANPSQHCHPSETQGYPQYQYVNGIQQPPPQQQMQVYFMPTNNPASYRTYSQFMNQPQAPHVMGPGMHFVYLSPPMAGGVMGMEGNTVVSAAPNPQVYQTNPGHNHPVRHTMESSNTNNNNAKKDVQQQPEVVSVQESSETELKDVLETAQEHSSSQEEEESDVKTIDLATSVTVQNGIMDDSSIEDISTNRNDEDTEEASQEQTTAAQEYNPDEFSKNDEKCATCTTGTEQISSRQTTTPPVSSNESQPANSTTPTSSNSSHTTYEAHSRPVMHHQHPGAPVLLSNIPQDYRLAGMNMANPVSYPAGMIPQYSVYPNIGPGPYLYLPTASAARSPKLPDMKMYPQATPHHSRSPGLVAVQLPNQSQIQFLPTASLQHQNQFYYTPQGYMTSDHTSQAQAPTQSSHSSVKPEVTPQTENDLQVTDEAVTARNVSPQQATEDETTAQVSLDTSEGADHKDPPAESVDTTPEAQ